MPTRWKLTRGRSYVISVAAELAGMHPQTLRIYERKGLIEPARTSGRSRRYSDRDIELLRRIQELTNDGVSLAGVQRILELEDELHGRASTHRRARSRDSTRCARKWNAASQAFTRSTAASSCRPSGTVVRSKPAVARPSCTSQR